MIFRSLRLCGPGAALLGFAAASLLLRAADPWVPDWRDITTGSTIPSEHYTDQPYVVVCNDGAWLCVVTTAAGTEGATTSHVVSSRSTDRGRTWSPIVPLEPSGPPESAYATAVKVPSGRIYAFYNHNSDNVRSILRFDGTPELRVDSMGHLVFRYTEDGGRTWSKQRYEIPIRETEVDRNNIYHGRIRFFWHVGRPLIHRGSVYVTLHKIGSWPMDHSEGNFLQSDNLLTEPDPAKIHWVTLPDGDIGLRPPARTVGEEQSLVDLSDGSLFTAYRTITGYSAQAYSRDDGHHWTPPAYMTYQPEGRRVKNPRAANFVWRVAPDRYLYWFENNGGRDDPNGAHPAFNARNPAWISAGREMDTPTGRCLIWSQPEMLLYGDSSKERMSYPDLIVDHDRYFVTETQKTIARVHEIPSEFLEMLWHQCDLRTVTRRGLVTELKPSECRPGTTASVPPYFDAVPDSARGGLTLDLWVRFKDLAPGQVLLEARDAKGCGFALGTTRRGTVELELRGATDHALFGDPDVAEQGWDTDAGLFGDGGWHHLAFIVDNGPKLILSVVDGVLCDGGAGRPFGWARYSNELRTLPTGGVLTLAPNLHGEIRGLRVYASALRVSEAVGNWRAGRNEPR
jgi:hypothetical protein